MLRSRDGVSGAGPALTVAVALVWLHQGLWCKVMRRDPTHGEIMASAPWIGAARARSAATLLGSVEAALSGWVLSGRAPYGAAGAQSVLLAGMNAGGLLFAPERIPHAGRMLARNACFLAAVWTVPALRTRSDR